MDNEKSSKRDKSAVHSSASSSPPRSPSPSPLDSLKASAIRDACRDCHIPSLAALAVSEGGLLHDELRRTAWPILLGCTTPHNALDWECLPEHKDEAQVRLDVDRSFVYYPTDRTDSTMSSLKSSLQRLISSVLRTHPSLSYFQGYHDIASVLLLVLGPSDAPSALARLSLLRIRDFMLPSLSPALAHLNLLPAILYKSDPPLARLLPPNPFYALSATLTLFAHVVPAYGSIARLFDYLLAASSAAPIYLFAAVVRSRKDELLSLIDDGDRDDGLPDQDVLHFALAKVPAPMKFDALIADAEDLLRLYPPESLGYRAWTLNVYRASVLRTAKNGASDVAGQSIRQGEKWREEHEKHAERMGRLKKRWDGFRKVLGFGGVGVGMFGRRRVGRGRVVLFGGAVAVAIVALLVARNGRDARFGGLGELGYGTGGMVGVVVREVWRGLGGA